MVIVWGSIEAKAESIEEVTQLSLEHVRRSRQEAGCISHSVQSDLENGSRFIFFEEWEDMPALQAHFKLAESQDFVASVASLALGPPSMKIFTASQVS